MKSESVVTTQQNKQATIKAITRDTNQILSDKSNPFNMNHEAPESLRRCFLYASGGYMHVAFETIRIIADYRESLQSRVSCRNEHATGTLHRACDETQNLKIETHTIDEEHEEGA